MYLSRRTTRVSLVPPFSFLRRAVVSVKGSLVGVGAVSVKGSRIGVKVDVSVKGSPVGVRVDRSDVDKGSRVGVKVDALGVEGGPVGVKVEASDVDKGSRVGATVEGGPIGIEVDVSDRVDVAVDKSRRIGLVAVGVEVPASVILRPRDKAKISSDSERPVTGHGGWDIASPAYEVVKCGDGILR